MSDKSHGFNYLDLMVEGTAFIQVKIDTSLPIELNDFIGAFASIASEYERFIKQEHPDVQADTVRAVDSSIG